MKSWIENALLKVSVVCLGLVVSANQASAHVKWFSTFDVATQPSNLDYLQLHDFKILVVLALLVMALGCLLEESPLGPPVLNSFDRVTAWLRTDTDALVRTVCGFFFVALWTMGGIILTPELKTAAPWISWLQLAIAISLIWRVTSPFAALGIVVLFALAVREYGIFHLADYPIFLGIAAYLALTGLKRDFFGIRPIDIVRWAAAITLMWASVEKWAYPQWSFPLIENHPSLTLGYEGGFFMRAAGVIEFTLAFALLWTPLVRRAAAVVLAAMFIGACFEFGKVDVIGHAGIVVVLLVIIGDDARVEVRRKHMLLAPAGFAAALAGFLMMYYGGHAMYYGRHTMLFAQSPIETAAAMQIAVEPSERIHQLGHGPRLTQREPSASSLDESHTEH